MWEVGTVRSSVVQSGSNYNNSPESHCNKRERVFNKLKEVRVVQYTRTVTIRKDRTLQSVCKEIKTIRKLHMINGTSTKTEGSHKVWRSVRIVQIVNVADGPYSVQDNPWIAWLVGLRILSAGLLRDNAVLLVWFMSLAEGTHLFPISTIRTIVQSVTLCSVVIMASQSHNLRQ